MQDDQEREGAMKLFREGLKVTGEKILNKKERTLEEWREGVGGKGSKGKVEGKRGV